MLPKDRVIEYQEDLARGRRVTVDTEAEKDQVVEASRHLNPLSVRETRRGWEIRSLHARRPRRDGRYED